MLSQLAAGAGDLVLAKRVGGGCLWRAGLKWRCMLDGFG